MVNQHFHTYIFQPIRNPNYYVANNNLLTNTRFQVRGKVNEYFLKALGYIQYIIRMLQSESQFIKKYTPVIQELPKMYHLAKAFNELKAEEDKVNKGKDEAYTTEQNRTYKEPGPTLFI